MKTKLNTKTIVAAVASVIGLAVYGYTSMVGYLAASATSTLPVVLTVAALVCLALRQFAGQQAARRGQRRAAGGSRCLPDRQLRRIRSGPRFAGCGRLLHPGQLSGF